MISIAPVLLSALVAYPGFTDRPMDSNGWIRFMPEADTRIHYVSASGNNSTAKYYLRSDAAVGADPYNPVGPVQAYATLASALTAVRSGYGDWVLLKRGDTWYTTMTRYPNGKSVSQPFLLGAYGQGPRPVLKAGTSSFCAMWTSWSYAAFVGLYIYAHSRDPNSPEYVASNYSGRGFRFACNAGQTVRGITVEDCVIRFFDTGIVVQGDGSNYDYLFRRNQILDCYNSPNSEGHSCGFYAHHASILLEENLFDHNGWLVQGVPPGTDNSGGKATMYSHNTYFTDCSTSVFRGNLFLRGSSMGNKWRADTTAASRHIILDNNLFFEGEIGAGIGGNTTAALRFEDVRVISNVFTDCGTSRPTGRTLGWNLEISDWNGGIVADNLFINQTNTGVGGVYGIHVNATSSRNVTITRNKFHGLYSTSSMLILDRNSAMTGINVSHNQVQSHVYGDVLADADSAMGGFTFSSNIYFSTRTPSQWFRVGGSYYGFANWLSFASDAGARTNKLAYPFPRRTVYTYLADLGRSNTVVEFVAALRAQSRTTWNTNFTAGAINEYLRRGFQCIRIATTGLSTGVIGQAYSCVLQSDGGAYSNWWSLAGGELPEGLSLSADGCIDGTPADLFSADVSIRVDDSAGGRDVMSFPLVVVPEPASLLALAACLALARRRQRA